MKQNKERLHMEQFKTRNLVSKTGNNSQPNVVNDRFDPTEERGKNLIFPFQPLICRPHQSRVRRSESSERRRAVVRVGLNTPAFTDRICEHFRSKYNDLMLQAVDSPMLHYLQDSS
jgi:hypothetical protein